MEPQFNYSDFTNFVERRQVTSGAAVQLFRFYKLCRTSSQTTVLRVVEFESFVEGERGALKHLERRTPEGNMGVDNSLTSTVTSG